MRKLILFFALFISAVAFANDGMFYSNGSNLMPMKETSIEMQKEVLYLKRIPGGFEVNVYFEFYNPGAARDEIVGFVTPPSSDENFIDEDLPGSAPKNGSPLRHPFINEFMVMVNGQLLPYEVARFDSTGFNSEIAGSNYGADYVYYFNVHFEPGKNIIRHHYIFKGFSSIYEESFNYRLTTGKMWSKDAIGDFELIIESPETYMRIPETFYNDKRPALWQVLGIGKLAGEDYAGWGNTYMRSGLLRFQTINFAPDYDLTINIPSQHVILEELPKFNPGLELPFLMDLVYNTDSEYKVDFEEFSDSIIQMLINYLYVKHGLLIRNEESAAVFKNLVWYIPDPNLKADQIKLSEQEQRILNALVAERSKRKEK